MEDNWQTCVEQERAYTEGWRDCQHDRITSSSDAVRKFYAKGWSDANSRSRRPAMYAASIERGMVPGESPGRVPFAP